MVLGIFRLAPSGVDFRGDTCVCVCVGVVVCLVVCFVSVIGAPS